jgi:ribosomal-protein-alanine N-acetyltransferase
MPRSTVASGPHVPKATARLSFRAWRDDDLPLARALFGDPRVTRLVGGPFDDAQIAARLASELAMQRAHGFAYWPIATVDGDVGCCGLKPRDAAGELELGYYLRPELWGGGYAAEAARSVIEHAFEVLRVDLLFALHHPENHGSGRVLEKVGFAYSHHELYPPTGLMHRGYVLRNSAARPA